MATSRRTVRSLAGATALVCVGVLAGCGGSQAAPRASGCLRSHGWKVERISSDGYVATRGPDELSYGASGEPVFSVAPGRTGTGLPHKTGRIRFACFPKLVVSANVKTRRSTATLNFSSSGG